MQRMIDRRRRLAGLGLDDRNAALLAKGDQLALGVSVEDAAAADDQRFLRPAQRRNGVGKLTRIGRLAALAMDLRGEERFGIIVSLRLHVLAEGERDRAAISRVGEHDKRPRQRRNELFGANNAVEIARHRAEAIVGADRAVAEILDLLQHRIGAAIGEDIARQQQDGQAVDVSERGGGDHVGCAGADRRRARHHAPPTRGLGEGDRRVRHRLLIVSAIGRECLARRVERFAQTRDIAVPEDREHPREQRRDLAVDLGLLRREEADSRLGGGEAKGFHGRHPLTAIP